MENRSHRTGGIENAPVFPNDARPNFWTKASKNLTKPAAIARFEEALVTAIAATYASRPIGMNLAAHPVRARPADGAVRRREIK